MAAIAVVALLLAGALGAGCNGPANPEPVLIAGESVFMQEDLPGEVALTGSPGATQGADLVYAVNLDGLDYVSGPVAGGGAFDLLLAGTAADRYRLIAVGRGEALSWVVLTAGAVPPEVVVVDEAELGCLAVTPPLLDLGSGPAGEPLYGEIVVTSDCPDPHTLVDLGFSAPYFTTASLAFFEPMEPGGRAVVSVVFQAPAGVYDALVVMDPDLGPDPTQVSLAVVVRAEALP